MPINPKIIKNIGYLSCWFLTNFVPKSENLLFIIQKTSISIYRSHAIECLCPKMLFWKSFLDTILQSRSVCNGPFSKILAVKRCLIQNHFSVFIWVKANLAWHNAYALMRLECKRCDILDCACKMIFAEVASRFEFRLGK